MLSRIAISVAMIAALTTSPVYVSARTCIISDAPVQEMCKPGCCANKKCCATSTKKTDPLSYAKNDAGPELNATRVASAILPAPDFGSLDRHLSASPALTCAVSPPQLAALCTFLI